MIEENLTETEATKLFRRIMDTIAEFRIVQMFGIITMVTLISRIMTMVSLYEGTKLIGEELKVQSK